MPVVPPTSTVFTRCAWAAVAGLSLLHALLQIPRWILALYTVTLDSSHAAAMQLLAGSGRQYGVDVAFTYGPFGYLTSCGPTYHPDTYLMCLTAWLVFAVAFWLAAFDLARWRLPATPAGAACALVVLTAVIAYVTAGPALDAFFLGLAALALLHHFGAGRSASSLPAVLLAVALGWVGYIKFTSFVAAAVVMAAITVDDLCGRIRPDGRSAPDRRARVPWVPLVYVSSIVCFWLLAGQRLANLPAYLRVSLEISSGYSEGQSLPGPLIEIAVFLVGMVLLLVGILVTARRAGRGACVWLFPAGAAAVLFLCFKAAFVRHDGHALIGGQLLLILALLLVPIILGAATSRRAAWVLVLIVLFAGIGPAWYLSRRHVDRSLPEVFGQLFGSLPLRATVMGRIAVGRSGYPGLFEANLHDLRVTNPIPPVQGATDVYSFGQTLALAHGLDYRPRPVFQSYTAFTPGLLERNADFLRGEEAPDTLLFELETVDNHYPSMDDGLSWPELLTRYDVEAITGRIIGLHRRADPRPYRLVPVREAVAEFGVPIDVPPLAEGLVWATFDIRPRLLGRLVNTVYKSPPLAITVTTLSGASFTYRIVPGMVRTGLLLSPLVTTRRDFASLLTGGWRQRLRSSEVTTVTIATGTGGSSRLYEPDVQVAFSRLVYEPQSTVPFGESDGDRRLDALVASFPGAQYPPRLNVLPSGETVVLAHAPSTLSLPVDVTTRRLSLRFGLLDGAWSAGGATDGVEFRVSIELAGTRSKLFSRTLAPLSRPEDRGTQTAEVEVDIPKGATLVFETLIGIDGRWDWSYWGAPELGGASDVSSR